VQHLSQRFVVSESDISKGVIETGNRTAIHFAVLAVATVHLDDGGLVTKEVRIRARATECLSPVSGESLDVLGVEAMAERMGDYVVGHHAIMPGSGQPTQSVHSARRLEDSLHASIMTIIPCLRKKMASASLADGTKSELNGC
jgi:hypothetical protein